jgi:endonuclease/exonuclease/phosphatase (EEP) superfamily protein YafD
MRWILALVLLSVACAERRPPEAPAAGQAHLRVMTYNVNYGIAGDAATMGAIEAGEAAVVLLQETTPAWEAALRARFSETYPHMGFHHCCGAGGLGVLSQHPFEDAGHLPPPEPAGWFPAWRIVVHAPLGDVQILNVHLRPQVSDSGSVVSGIFTTSSIRERQIAGFYPALDPELPTLVVGDFNESAGGSAIGYLADRGLVSALPRFTGPQDTWRWQTSVGTISTQLDHIVHDDRLAPLGVVVIARGRSDHLPVVGDFVLAQRPAR